MTKNEFIALCNATEGIKFAGYSGKEKTAYVSGKVTKVRNFKSSIKNANLPFKVMASEA